MEKDIVAQLKVSGNIYWKNGFLFANDIDKANGLKKFKGTELNLFVDNKDGKIGVCNFEMLKDNPNERGSKICIT